MKKEEERTPNRQLPSLKENSINKELLKTLLKFGEEETRLNTILIQKLIAGENSSVLANFNPKNHLQQLHQKEHE